MHLILKRTIPFLFFLLISIIGVTQNQRPKIGLVLSGGGAKGIAHIGVLKAMEEAGLTPDYITGTSMGSIVGALYAAGYSADELKEIVETADWGLLLSNKMAYNKVTFEEKPFYGRYLLDFYIKNRELQLPKGIIDGEALIEMFSNLTRHVHGVSDFNNLPIPFACIAADITTGEKVVLNKGSLAMSMRASMSIPSIFSPVKIDNHLLVDGGLVHNMPVTEVLEMGADIVIGVFVSTDLVPEEELGSAIAILTQSAFITSAFDSRQELAKCNILIEPELAGFSTGSFNSAIPILEKGEEAGKTYFQVFKNLADSLNQFGPPKKIEKPSLDKEYVFGDVIVEGNSVIEDDFIIGKMQIEPGQSVSIDHIEKRIALIYGTQYFEKLYYEILGAKDNLVLKIHATERPTSQLRFSYHYDSENKGGIVANATLRNVIFNRSRLIFEADLATYPRATVDYFKYLGKKQNLALEATGLFNRNELPGYDSVGNLNNIFSTNFSSAGLRFQTTIQQNGAFGIEAKLNSIKLSPKVGDNSIRALSNVAYNNTTFTFFHRFDNTDNRYFPTRGFKSEFKLSTSTKASGTITLGDTLKLDAELLGDILQTSNITALDITVFPIIPLTNRISLLIKSRLKLSELRSSTVNLTDYDYIGGFTPGWVNSNEYYGGNLKEFPLANYFYSRLTLQYKLRSNLFLMGHFNVLDTKHPVTWFYPNADIGKAGDRTNRYGYGATLGFSSPVGPIALSVAKDHFRSGWKASLVIGFYY